MSLIYEEIIYLKKTGGFFKYYARLNYYIRITEGDTWLFGGFLLWLFSTDMKKITTKHNSEMLCFNFLSSGKMCSEGTRNDCKLEDEGNVFTGKRRFSGQCFVFQVHVLHVGETDNS